MGALTWGRIAAAAGLGLLAAGVVYLTKTERGRQLAAQAKEKAFELYAKARESAQQATTTLQETAQAALGAGDGAPEEEKAAATGQS